MSLQEASGIVIIGVCGLLGVWVVGQRTRTLAPALVSFVLHLTLAVAILLKVGLFFPDALHYDAQAQQLSDSSTQIAVTSGKEGWPLLLSLLYRMFGHSPILGLLVNAIAAALTVCVLAHAAHRLTLPRRATAWILALLPTTLFWSSLLLRESLTWLFMAIILFALSGLVTHRSSLREMMIFAIGLAGLLAFRGTMAILMAAFGLAAIVLSRNRGRGIAISIVMIALVSVPGPVATKLDAIVGIYTPAHLNASRTALARTASTAFDTSVTDLQSAQSAIPRVLPRVLLGPFPWEWGAVGIPFALDGVLWCMILFLAIRGWHRHADRRQLLVAVLPAAALLVALAFTSGNYGTMVRLRLQATVLIIPLAAAGLTGLRPHFVGTKPAPQRTLGEQSETTVARESDADT